MDDAAMTVSLNPAALTHNQQGAINAGMVSQAGTTVPLNNHAVTRFR